MKVWEKSVRWHVSRLPGPLVDRLKSHLLNLVQGYSVIELCSWSRKLNVILIIPSSYGINSGFKIPPSSRNKICLVQSESGPEMLSLCWLPVLLPLDFPLDHVWRQWYVPWQRGLHDTSLSYQLIKLNSTLFRPIYSKIAATCTGNGSACIRKTKSFRVVTYR